MVAVRLREDRDLALVYGTGGVEQYWIVNAIDHQVEVCSDPGPRGYRSSKVYKPGQAVPLVIDGMIFGQIAVDDMLPRRP